MSPKRTKRIQTVISPEHHDLLTELTKTHGKMNHIIEQGIELVYQSKTGVHSCDASKTLNIQEQMIQNGYIFFDKEFIEQLIINLGQGTIIDWLTEYQGSNLEAGNPLLTIIEAENTFAGLLEYLHLESDYFKMYNVKFYDDQNLSITIQPLLFPNYPEITATILCRTLDFLKYDYNIDILNNQIILYFIKDKKKENQDLRNQAIRKRFETFWKDINPLGHYRFELASKEKDISSNDVFIKNLIEILDDYKVYYWESGNIIIDNARAIMLPQEALNNVLDNLQKQQNFELFNTISDKLFNFVIQDKNQNNLKAFFTNLGKFWSLWGFGELEFIEKDMKVILSKNVLRTSHILTVLNPVLKKIELKFDFIEDDSGIKDILELHLSGAKKKILVVDDEQDIIDALIRDIKKINKQLEINQTTDPHKALSLLESNKYNLILIDHKMKKMTGIQLLEQIKDKYPSMKRVLITGHGDSPLIMKDAINKANIHYFINKPWNKADLKTALD